MKRFYLLLLLLLPFLLHADNSKIQQYINDKFLQTYPSMHINQIDLKRTSKLPKEFEKYQLKEIYIAPSAIQREKGNISVIYTDGQKKRKLFYHFKLDATVGVLRTIQSIQKGKRLTEDLVEGITIKFTNFYQKPITPYYLNRYDAKMSIIEGKILTTRHISKMTDVKRGDLLTATLRDGAVEVSFQAVALKDAYINDIIKIKRNHKSFFKARIISNTKAVVVE
ncbi:MAG: flagellar basal body P-ring formation chaperone FlgA [Epsilonproteobacteria bacterium]|nr:flagellar basal body P-ring formation chaperone FlgA [Campylobacterota bacterium]